MAQTDSKHKASLRQIFDLIKDYFLNSDQKLIAWALLIGIILCVIAGVALMTLLAWWSAGFWALLAAKSLTPFLISIAEMCGLVAGMVGVFVLKNYLTGKLTNLWRYWLTNKIIDELFEIAKNANNFLDLKRSEIVANFGQRIQEDVKNFIDLTLTLSTSILSSILSLGAFSGTLWAIGGALTFTLLGLSIVIPGFLVWAALIVAIVATVATHFIAKSLQENTQAIENAEADLRHDLTQLNDKAEDIAQEHAEGYYKRSLKRTVQRVKDTADEKLKTETKLNGFQNFYLNMIQFLPTIFAAPLYFSGMISIGQLMQIGMSFGQVSMALSVFVESYDKIAAYRTSIDRINEFKETLKEDGLPNANAKLIARKERNKTSINLKNLDVQPPQASNQEYIMRGLCMKLVQHENVLIKGRRGSGKSTVLKLISDRYSHGTGKISVPLSENVKFYFLPQLPTLPPGRTLKAALAYPERERTYKDEDCIAALKIMGMNEFTSRLRDRCDWSTLSGGEKQGIALTRALLKKPDWLFLDEATSALDEESEAEAYRALNKHLPNTTIVSIGHRNTIEKYHSRILFFKMRDEEQRIIEVEEVQNDISTALM